MLHSSHGEALTSERLMEYGATATYVWMYVHFRDEGLTCLERDSTIGGKPGLDIMNMVLNYFVEQ